jgi:hypothetical protein
MKDADKQTKDGQETLENNLKYLISGIMNDWGL